MSLTNSFALPVTASALPGVRWALASEPSAPRHQLRLRCLWRVIRSVLRNLAWGPAHDFPSLWGWGASAQAAPDFSLDLGRSALPSVGEGGGVGAPSTLGAPTIPTLGASAVDTLQLRPPFLAQAGNQAPAGFSTCGG